MGLMVAIPQFRWTLPLVVLTCATSLLSIEARATAPAPDAKAVAPTATLTADAVFGFESTTLSTAGIDSLSSLFNSLGGPQRVMHLTLVGHSDPLETRGHGPQLALARAQAIRAFFVQQGVPTSAIEMSSVADTKSTVSDCAISRSPAATECHADDRRVELHALVNTGKYRPGAGQGEVQAVIPAATQPAAAPAVPPVLSATAPLASVTTEINATTPESSIVKVPELPRGNDASSQKLNVSASAIAAQTNPPAIPVTSVPVAKTAAAIVPEHAVPMVEAASSMDGVTGTTVDSGAKVDIQDPAAQAQIWHLEAGRPIGVQLGEWAKRVNWTVDWKYPKDILSPADKTYTGDFIFAASEVISTLHNNGAVIFTHFYKGTRTQRVYTAGLTTDSAQ